MVFLLPATNGALIFYNICKRNAREIFRNVEIFLNVEKGGHNLCNLTKTKINGKLFSVTKR